MKPNKITPIRTTTSAAAIAAVLSILQQSGVEIDPNIQSLVIVVGSAILGRLMQPAFDPGDGP